jgi:hypothetical protein
MSEAMAFDDTHERGIDAGRDGHRQTTGAVRTTEQAHPTRTLQRTIGNAQLCRVLRMAGPGSRMTPPDDRQPGDLTDSSQINRKQCHCDGDSAASDMCTECAEQQGAVQRYATQVSGPSHLPPSVTQAIQGGGGERLPDASRAHMESALGTDLSGVRIHTDPDTAHAANDINARAFTVGQDVYFGAGQYDPGTKRGNHLLAHELTHTLQQASGNVTTQADTPVSSPADPLEREAEAVAGSIGNPMDPTPSPRQPLRSRLTTPPMVQGAWYDVITDTAEAAWSGVKSVGSKVEEGAEWVGGEVKAGAEWVGGEVKAGAEWVGGKIKAGAEWLGKKAKAIAKALKLAAVALVDPMRIPAIIAEIAWDLLPEFVKGRVVNTLLDAAIAVARVMSAPMEILGFLASMLRQGMIGFLEEVRSYQTAVKIKIVDRVIKLWAQPSRDYIVGFLMGFALGLWDGLSGPFVALWDIVRLAWRAQLAEMEFIATLADSDRRRVLFNDLSTVMASTKERVAAVVEKFLSSKDAPQQLLAMIYELVKEAAAVAREAGAQVADALMSFFQKPDADLGHGLGRVAGNITFEAVLLILTEGGWALLKGALEGIRWISKAIEAVKDGARLLEGFTGLAAAFTRFTGVMRKSKVLSELIEPIEELYRLFVKYLKFSYGLGGAEERLGEHAGEEGERLAERLEREEVITDPLTGEPHELRLRQGVCERCSSRPCPEFVKSIGDRIDTLPAKPEGELLTRTKALRTRAKEIQDAGAKIEEGRRAVEAEKAAGTLTGKELRKREEALTRKASDVSGEMHALEVEMEGIEREERVRSKVVGEGFDQPLGKSDADIRRGLRLPEDSKVADVVGKRGDQWRVAESKGGNIDAAVTQVTNTANALVKMHPEAAGKLELEVYVKQKVFEKLESGQSIGGLFMIDGKLAVESDPARTFVFAEVHGAPIKILAAP